MSTAVQEFALALMRARAIKSSSTNDFIKAHADALKMEKEQIINAYETAEKDCGKDFLHGDLYYHETYLQSHTPKHYRVWFEDTMEEDGGYWWNAVTDPCGRLYDPNHPNEERDTVQWYIDNGYKIEEVTNG
jgi:hypothetical protein